MAYTIWPDFGCTLAVTATTGCNQNTSGSDLACLLGSLHMCIYIHCLYFVDRTSCTLNTTKVTSRKKPVT